LFHAIRQWLRRIVRWKLDSAPRVVAKRVKGAMDAGFVGVAIAIAGVTMVGIYLMWPRD
jgi:hypothetical protein